MGVIGEKLSMIERLLLATVATLCFYFFFLQLGDNLSQPNFFGKGLSRTSNLMFNIPAFSR
jgi:hypothetical protein